MGLFFAHDTQAVTFLPQPGDFGLIVKRALCHQLVAVMRPIPAGMRRLISSIDSNPTRNIQLSVTIGTVVVAVLYIVLNLVFFRATPSEMRGKAGGRSPSVIFGNSGGELMAGLICPGPGFHDQRPDLGGPRVTQRMGRDLFPLRVFARTTAGGFGGGDIVRRRSPLV